MHRQAIKKNTNLKETFPLTITKRLTLRKQNTQAKEVYLFHRMQMLLESAEPNVMSKIYHSHVKFDVLSGPNTLFAGRQKVRLIRSPFSCAGQFFSRNVRVRASPRRELRR